jgi:FlaA1/EpsC-like NDP-sugar epimerase
MRDDTTALEGKRVLVTGGTGSFGQVFVQRLLEGKIGRPAEIVVFSRDEAKQHDMRLRLEGRPQTATDEVIYQHRGLVRFMIGDIRDLGAVARSMHGIDVVFSAAALKQVPTCEYFPWEAVRTNVEGMQNILRAIYELRLSVELVVGLSTDKAVKPVNAMGLTKALQERLIQTANMYLPNTRCVGVRYGNVLASRGSVIPLFHDQIRRGGPVTITHPEMTRFFMTLDDAVDVIFAAMRGATPGETWVPHMPAARVVDVAQALIGDRRIEVAMTGVRPGEKLHEVLISEEEVLRTRKVGRYYAIASALPEVHRQPLGTPALTAEYSSATNHLTPAEIRSYLEAHRLLVEQSAAPRAELLR